MILVTRTKTPNQLATIYTATNVFFNPTTENNYPTVNLEAEACSTPVLTYNTGGCQVTVKLPDSKVVEGYQQGLAELQRFGSSAS